MEEFLQYTNFILAVGVIIVWCVAIIVMIGNLIGSKVEKNKFFKAAEKSLKYTGIDESVKGITNDFEVYRNHGFGFKSKTVIELCQELEQRLKLRGDSEYTQKLDNVISLFKDEYRFDDEKNE